MHDEEILIFVFSLTCSQFCKDLQRRRFLLDACSDLEMFHIMYLVVGLILFNVLNSGYCYLDYIQVGKCLNVRPYTIKIFDKIKDCKMDCVVNSHCKAIAFDRLSRECLFYTMDTDVQRCPGKYLILKKNLPAVSYMFFFIWRTVSTEIFCCNYYTNML